MPQLNIEDLHAITKTQPSQINEKKYYRCRTYCLYSRVPTPLSLESWFLSQLVISMVTKLVQSLAWRPSCSLPLSPSSSQKPEGSL